MGTKANVDVSRSVCSGSCVSPAAGEAITRESQPRKPTTLNNYLVQSITAVTSLASRTAAARCTTCTVNRHRAQQPPSTTLISSSLSHSRRRVALLIIIIMNDSSRTAAVAARPLFSHHTSGDATLPHLLEALSMSLCCCSFGPINTNC